MRILIRLAILSVIPIVVIVFIVRLLSPANPQQLLSEGPHVLTGILRAAPLSLGRRGTHILQSAGIDQVYVESTTAVLRSFEGLEVTVDGVVERNSDPAALPVLIASEVTLVQPPTKEWNVQSLQLSFEAPIGWQGTDFADGIKMTSPESVGSSLRVYKTGSAQLPDGVSVQVGGRNAMLVRGEQELTVFVQHHQDVLAFSFDASTAGNASLSPQQLLLLRSVRFLSPVDDTASVQSGSGALGIPCGGSAGILCPDGYYCEISDSVEGIGRCRSLR